MDTSCQRNHLMWMYKVVHLLLMTTVTVHHRSIWVCLVSTAVSCLLCAYVALKHAAQTDICAFPGGAGAPSSPLVHLLPHLFPFYFFLSFIGFTYFLLSIPSLSTRIVPLRFQAGGRRRRPNLGLVSFFCFFFVCNLCYLYSLVKMHCGVFWFTFVCSFSALTLLVGSFDP